MARYIALFTGKPDAPRLTDPEIIARGMKAWSEWMATHAAHIVDTGGPLGRTRKVSAAGITDVRNTIGGYVIVEASDHEAAARMFEGHPQCTIFPGDGVEVMPCLPIPVA